MIIQRSLILFFLVLSVTWSGCFRKFIKSDRDIEKHYQSKTVKPEFDFFETPTGKIHFVRFSPSSLKPLLVFIHGAPGAWYGWMNLLDDSILQKNFEMVAMDRPGYGKSEAGPQSLSISEQAKRISFLLKNLKGNRDVILVGRSYGSPVAARLAMDYPDLVQGMVLISSAVDPSHEKFFWFSGLGKNDFFRRLIPHPINRATDEKFKHVEELRQLLPCWSQIRVPVRIMVGENDNIVDPVNSQFLDSVLVNSPHSVISLPGVDHLISYRKPDLVRNEIFEMQRNVNLAHSMSLKASQAEVIRHVAP